MSHVFFQPLASLEQARQTPSGAEGLDWELEQDIRAFGCKLIQQAGLLLKQKQVAMATAQVLFHRFWYVTSMTQYGMTDIAMGSLYLASKLEECPIRIRDLINTFDLLLTRAKHTLSLSPSSPPTTTTTSSSPIKSSPTFKYTPMQYFAQEFYDAKDAMVVSEMQILKRLGFNVRVQLPYGTMVNYLQVLGLADHEEVPQSCWDYLNDGLQTPIYALYPFPTIACSSILLSTRTHGVPLPEGWNVLFDAETEDMMSCAGYIMRLYRPRPGGKEEGEECMRLVLGGKRGLRRWLEEKRA